MTYQIWLWDLKHYLQIIQDQSALNQRLFWKCSYDILMRCSISQFEENTGTRVAVSNLKGRSKALIPLIFWVLAMRGKVTSAPQSPSSPFRRPSPPFPKLSKYARGNPDRWTLISLAIWPQFVFLANEADYWGWLMASKSIWLLLLYFTIWILQRNVYNNRYWNCLSAQVY